MGKYLSLQVVANQTFGQPLPLVYTLREKFSFHKNAYSTNFFLINLDLQSESIIFFDFFPKPLFYYFQILPNIVVTVFQPEENRYLTASFFTLLV